MGPSITLADLLAEAPGLRVRQRFGGDVEITGVGHDSRAVARGLLFCCVRGDHVDGHTFAADAVTGGAAALLTEHALDFPVPQIVVDDSRVAMAHIADAFYDHPSHAMDVVGVTGTNGKTTTAWILRAVLDHAGRRTGLLGTLTGAYTTPEAPELQSRLAAFRDEGCDAVAMEVSSHALAQHRVDATRFRVGVFTNLGRDHLDFHETQERYFAAKARLFDADLTERGVVNADDRYGQLLADAAVIPITRFALADAHDLVVGPQRCQFRWRGHQVTLPLGGRFNVANALAAAAAASALGLADDVVAAGLASVAPVPGRFESVDGGQPFSVIVDFAHTPDGMTEVLATARQAAAGARVLVVFGCGGDRDATKRPRMGAIAAELADLAVVTSDNPRQEDPAAIISAVISEIPPDARAELVVEPDRRAAIAVALRSARRGDVVVVAGKGHETTQTIGLEARPFDDRVVVRELLEAMA